MRKMPIGKLSSSYAEENIEQVSLFNFDMSFMCKALTRLSINDSL